MADIVTIMRTGGLRVPEPVAAAAATVGVEPAGAAALAQKETNAQPIWGHDPVDTGGCYTKGAEVTPANYRCYRQSPTAGWQGVGHLQLTYKGYIVQAEKLHPDGAADHLTNCRVGLQALKDLQRQHGEQDGARAYNGTNGAAQAYGRDWVVKRNEWRRRFAGAAPAPNPVPAPAGRPTLRLGDRGPLVSKLQDFANRVFPAYAGLKVDGVFGDATGRWLRTFQDRSGIPSSGTPEIGPRTWAALERSGFR